MAFRWRADDGPTLNAGLAAFVIFQGIRTSIAKKPYVCYFSGGRDPLPPPPLDPHMQIIIILASFKLACAPIEKNNNTKTHFGLPS